jgi:hypothetical protein
VLCSVSEDDDHEHEDDDHDDDRENELEDDEASGQCMSSQGEGAELPAVLCSVNGSPPDDLGGVFSF